MINKNEQIQEIIFITEENLRDKIYMIRGVQVMLDSDLAKIYGYETRYFNRQIKNNLVRFQGDEFFWATVGQLL